MRSKENGAGRQRGDVSLLSFTGVLRAPCESLCPAIVDKIAHGQGLMAPEPLGTVGSQQSTVAAMAIQ